MAKKRDRTRAVVAIGVFDGLHRGHQLLLRRVCELAAGADCVAGLVTFDPPPFAFFAGDPAPLEITPLPEKTALLAELGLTRLMVLPFEPALAGLPATAFVDEVLLREFELVAVVVGHDFRFGAGRAGDGDLLRDLGRTRGFTVEIIGPVMIDGQRVSSTKLRQDITEGRVAAAAHLMGRPLCIEGRVGCGQGLGSRELVPTANLETSPRQLLPGGGVYAVEVATPLGTFGGAAHVGPAPTTGAGHERLVEVHLIDFKGDLRGMTLRVAFLDWLRAHRAFADLGSLRVAIAADIQAARDRCRKARQNRLAAPDPM